jgi:hypothetical protein
MPKNDTEELKRDIRRAVFKQRAARAMKWTHRIAVVTGYVTLVVLAWRGTAAIVHLLSTLTNRL